MMAPKVQLIYDQQCPACDYYCHIVRIRQSVGELQLIDARENSQIMAQITDQGLDIDQGMVLKLDDRLYYGADAIHMLALMSSRSGMMNRINYWLFRSKNVSKVLYPLLKALRNLLLKCLGKRKINNLGLENNDTF